MLKLQITGAIGQDCQQRATGNNVAISFSVAHTETWYDANNTKQERTTWVSCTYWRPVGKTKIAEYLLKGTKVYVEGTPSARGWINKNNAQQADSALECRVFVVELLSAAPNKGNNQQGNGSMNTQGQQRQGSAVDQYNNNNGGSNAQPAAQPQQGFDQNGNFIEAAPGEKTPDWMNDDVPF